MNQDSVERKLSAARTRLVLDKPFLGALVLRLPLIMANPEWCATTATNAKKLYYNADYIDALNIDQVQFILAHEALHCALSHFARRQHRNKHRWDVACDYAINPLLLQDGLKAPPGMLSSLEFSDMTAEEIYPCIEENTKDQPMDQHIYDQSEPDDTNQPPPETEENTQGEHDKPPEPDAEPDPDSGASQPPPLTGAEQDALSIQWQQRLAGAAQQAIQAGKMNGALARLVDHLLQPKLPWRMLLAKYMTATARDDYSYMRPSRRASDAIMPSLRSSQINVVVAIDTSGSIAQTEMDAFLAEIDALKGQMRARLTLLACDATLAKGAPWVFEPWDTLTLPEKFKGGGGTDFTPVFDWANAQTIAPDMLLYFTDAEGKFPTQEPIYPTLWLVKGKQKVPFGQRIQLN